MARKLGEKQRPRDEEDNVVALNPDPIPNVPPEVALRATLLNGVADLRGLDEKISTAMAKVKTLRSDRKAVVGKLGAAGLPASLIAEAMADADNTRTDIAEKEKAREFIRDTFALPKADWGASFETMPEGAVEEVEWFEKGKTAGALAGDRNPPDTCPNGACSNEFMRGYDEVQTQRAMEIGQAPIPFD